MASVARAASGALAVAAVLSMVACGGGGGSGSSSKKVTTNSVTAAGDVKMSGSAGLKDGKLALTLSAIKDPDDPSKPADPSMAAFGVAVNTPAAKALLAAAAADPFTCSVTGVSSASASKIDLVFINDTTGSMDGTVLGIASSIQSFATSVAGSGVDAKFSMYTYGDDFATKLPSGSEFTVGKGDFALEGDLFAADDVERPYVGLSDLTGFQAFLAELTCNTGGPDACVPAKALGNDGGDDAENTIGALDYALKKVAWRDGAAKVFIAIGDNPSHQQGDGGLNGTTAFPAAMQPTTGDDLVSRFSGDATIHVVGNDTTDPAPFYNLKSLSDGTGGGFLELPSSGDVDLSALHMDAWFTKAFSGACSGAPSGHYLVVVSVSVTGSLGTVKTGTLTFDITIG
jgi:hypothetical protein